MNIIQSNFISFKPEDLPNTFEKKHHQTKPTFQKPSSHYLPFKLYDKVVFCNFSSDINKNIFTLYGLFIAVAIWFAAVLACFFATIMNANTNNTHESINWAYPMKYLRIIGFIQTICCLIWGLILDKGFAYTLKNPMKIITQKQFSIQSTFIGLSAALIIIKFLCPTTTSLDLFIIVEASLVAISVGQACGRIMCFVCGCCHGNEMEQHKWYSLYYSHPLTMIARRSSHLINKPLFPVQILASLLYFFQFAILFCAVVYV